MSDGDRYKEHANVCLRLARFANETDRPLLLSMAEAWLELADSAYKIEAAADAAALKKSCH